MAKANSKGHRAVRGAQPNIKAASPTSVPEPAEVPDADDRDSVLAFLIGMQPVPSCEFPDEVDKRIQAGRRLIGKMASAHGVDSLSIAQAADILCFITCNESAEPLDWHTWESPSRVRGLDVVLETIERSLRAMEVQS